MDAWIAHCEAIIRDYELVEASSWPYIEKAIDQAFKDNPWYEGCSAMLFQPDMSFERFKEDLQLSLGYSRPKIPKIWSFKRQYFWQN